MNSLTTKQISLIVIFASVLLRLISFASSANFGADSISRSFISLNWSSDPFLIWHPNSETSVWLPLQFYINGILLMIWDNVQLVPRLVSLLASLISLPLFFLLARQLFAKEKAFFATACFSLYALHIKFGNIAGSESLFIFFMLAAMYAYHRFLDTPGLSEIVCLGGVMLFAVMIRFEAWLLPPFIIMALLLRAMNSAPPHRRRLITGAVVACIPPALFMALWMYGSFQEYGDYLYSVHAASSEHTALTKMAADRLGSMKAILYKAAFWPGVLFVSLSPLILIAGLWGLMLTLFKRTGMEWVVLFIIQAGIYLYQSIISGELAPLARYTILPGTILCLFSARGSFALADKLRFPRWRNLKIHAVLILALVWIILLCPNFRDSGNPYLKKLSSVSPVTQYPTSVEPVISWLKSNLQPDQSVIFNSPYFTSNAIIMYSGMTPEQIISVNENSLEDMNRTILDAKPSYLICHQDAHFLSIMDMPGVDASISLNNITLQSIDSAGDFKIYMPQYQP